PASVSAEPGPSRPSRKILKKPKRRKTETDFKPQTHHQSAGFQINRHGCLKVDAYLVFGLWCLVFLIPSVIALLDYGSGNLRSVEKALKKVGADVRVTQSPEGVRGARGVVLPGVGAFDDCVNA